MCLQNKLKLFHDIKKFKIKMHMKFYIKLIENLSAIPFPDLLYEKKKIYTNGTQFYITESKFVSE